MRTAPHQCLLALVCSSVATAILTAAPVPKAKAPNSDFSAFICGTIQYAHSDIWDYTPAASTPTISTAKEIVRGQKMDIIVNLGEFATDAQGNADVVYDLTLSKPDGTTQVIGKDLVAFKGHVPAPHMVHQATESRGFFVPADNPLGTYRYSAKLKDRIGRAEVEVSGEVSVLDSSNEQPLPADFDVKKMGEWLMHYYERPDPRMALPVLRFLAHDQFIASHPGGWPPMLGAYEMILRDNPWLVAQFQQRLLAVETDKAEQDRLFYVLAYVFRADPGFGHFLPEHMREDFRAAQQQPWPDPDQELLTGSQLDLLWGRFFATGSFAPIQRLVSVLAYDQYMGSIEAFKKLDPKPAVAPAGVQKEAVYRAAMWSLKSNASQHPLVYNYLAYLVNDPKTRPASVLPLAFILGAKVKTADGKVIDTSKPPAGGNH